MGTELHAHCAVLVREPDGYVVAVDAYDAHNQIQPVTESEHATLEAACAALHRACAQYGCGDDLAFVADGNSDAQLEREALAILAQLEAAGER